MRKCRFFIFFPSKTAWCVVWDFTEDFQKLKFLLFFDLLSPSIKYLTEKSFEDIILLKRASNIYVLFLKIIKFSKDSEHFIMAAPEELPVLQLKYSCVV